MNFIFKKILALIAVTFTMLSLFVIGLFLDARFLKNDASVFAQSTPSQCAKIIIVPTKSYTKEVLVSGIPNSGTFDFNAVGDWEACAEKAGNEILIKGWTRNTNLGWASFYCGTDGKNRGVNCGQKEYGANINITDGRVWGFGYGDNIGWISMGCSSGKNGAVDCGTVNYGVRVALADGEISGKDNGNCGTMQKGDLYGYAWTDTVGWMNFCGAHVDLSALETPPAETPPTGTSTTTTPDTGTNPPYMEIYPPKLPEYQQARVTGNVLANMIVDTKNLTKKDWISNPIGEQTASSRERFLRTAKKSSAGLTPDEFDFLTPNTKTIDATDTIPQGDDKTKILYFKRKKNTTEPCKIVFDDKSEIQYGQQKDKSFITMVSEGCDVYIDRNLRSTYRKLDEAKQYDFPLSRLGIVAFSDLSMPGERKGGNVYICSRVTDVESHLVMDGSLFSYGKENEGGEMDCDDKEKLIDQNSGLPVLPILQGSIKSLLRNQLVIVGMFFGSNTYGGAVADKPALGTGEIVGTSPEEIKKARLFDLNFLRYANVENNTEEGKTDQLCWSKNTQLAKYLLPAQYKNKKQEELIKIWPKICTTNFPIDSIDHDGADPQALTTIIYMDPTADLPIFNGMAGKSKK